MNICGVILSELARINFYEIENLHFRNCPANGRLMQSSHFCSPPARNALREIRET